ncbi:MAG: radical SAM family heme chaperone HemW [Anaerolineae bacterium]|jgi:oxygen-independent coproporphyrinogen-3 oxidase
MEDNPAIGLYAHIPFCQAKCSYCDFASEAGLEALFEDYVNAMVRELETADPARVRSVYIGGGTPTVLAPALLGRILKTIKGTFDLEPGAEVTVEANPGTVDGAGLAALRALGANRLSLGVQSFKAGELALLGRIHNATEAIAAFGAAREAGFEKISLDLIYGLPGQGMAAWQHSLAQALSLAPEHLSLYCLSVEEGTPLAAAIRHGNLPAPDADLAAEMYEWAEKACAQAGYHHYEISNWAREPEMACRHNLIYWRNEPYRGIGASAHSWAGGRRWANLHSPAEYVARVLAGGSPVMTEEEIGPDLEIGETVMLGLRLVEEGVTFERFQRRFDLDLRQRFGKEIKDLAAWGLLAVCTDRLRLTPRGRLLGNQVFGRFLPA